MRRSIRIRGGRSTIAVAVAAVTVAFAAFVPTFATGDVIPPGATVATVDIKFQGNLPKFVAPATVPNGAYLNVVNKTNPSQFGPHTFSLVTQGAIPKTKQARHNCFKVGHICTRIGVWHGTKANGSGPVTENPALAGAPGWDTLGNLHKKGDSWFTGFKPHNSFAQQVTAPVGTTLYFQCAIHPFMKGSIDVVAPTP
jgi:hypothetical protein